MASGVKVADRVKDTYNEMKIAKNDDERIRLVTFVIKDQCIDVEKVYQEKDIKGDAFLFFKDLLLVTECRYILYDCHFQTDESIKKELVFAMWCPDKGRAKDKLNYASSKDAIKKVLDGIKHHLQLNDPSDCPDRDGFAVCLGNNVICVEGHNVKNQTSR